MHKILFVCLGNICRSPFAQAVMQHLVREAGVDEHYIIDSAGIGAWHTGQQPDMRMQQAARQRGYTMRHYARQVNSDDFLIFDLVIGMDQSNIDDLRRLAPDIESAKKIHLLTEFCTDRLHKQYPHRVIDHVPDPYYGGVEGFHYAMDVIQDACLGLFREVESL